MPAMTRMRYLGNLKQGQRIVEFPIPFLAKNEKCGEVVFGKEREADVPTEWAEKLEEFGGGQFEILPTPKSAKPPDAEAAVPIKRKRKMARRGRPPTRKVIHATSDGAEADADRAIG